MEGLEEGCGTPTRSGCRIPAATLCPPPPKKNREVYPTSWQRVPPPKNGYFKLPDVDLELMFRSTTREALA